MVFVVNTYYKNKPDHSLMHIEEKPKYDDVKERFTIRGYLKALVISIAPSLAIFTKVLLVKGIAAAGIVYGVPNYSSGSRPNIFQRIEDLIYTFFAYTNFAYPYSYTNIGHI